MESSSNNIFNWLFRPKQTSPARDHSQCVPQSSSDSPMAPSPCGILVSLEIEQHGSGASGPAEAERSSPSEEEKTNSNARADDQLTEIVGLNDSDNDYNREKEDCADCMNSESRSTFGFIHAAPINIKTAEVNVQEKEGLKDMLGEAEFQTAKVKVEEKEESEENLLQDQCRAKEIILEEKEEYDEKPRQNEDKGVEPGVNGKEISTREMPGQTEHEPTNAKLKVKEDSEDDPGQTESAAGKWTTPEKEEPLNIGEAQCKAVKVNMKENDGSKEEPGKSEVKAAKKVKKKAEAKVEPTKTKLQGSSVGVEAKRGSNGEVENGRTEVGGKQVEEEKESREGEEEKAKLQNQNRVGNKTEKGNTEKKEDTRGGPDKHIKYPVRPEAEDCAHYMKTWTCKFGSNCKFNHPVRKKFQAAKQKMKEMEESKEKPGQTNSKEKKEEAPKEKSGQTKSKATKEKVKEKTDSIGNTRQFECKFYSNPESCKFGKGCKFSHKKANFVPPAVRHNFMGLPMRPGVKDCTYFMLTATCISDVKCKFNHPDPTPVIDDEPCVQDSHGDHTSSQQSPSPDESTLFVSMENSVYNTEWSPSEFPLNPLPKPPTPPYFAMQTPTSQEQWEIKDGEETDYQHGYLSETRDCDFRSTDKDHQMS